jgi:hypothetical protein
MLLISKAISEEHAGELRSAFTTAVEALINSSSSLLAQN